MTNQSVPPSSYEQIIEMFRQFREDSERDRIREAIGTDDLAAIKSATEQPEVRGHSSKRNKTCKRESFEKCYRVTDVNLLWGILIGWHKKKNRANRTIFLISPLASHSTFLSAAPKTSCTFFTNGLSSAS
jgi:hypothetical protein